jgi:hypothetical protein
MSIWSILRPLKIFYGSLVYFVVIWYISWSFGIFFGMYTIQIWQPCVACQVDSGGGVCSVVIAICLTKAAGSNPAIGIKWQKVLLNKRL